MEMVRNMLRCDKFFLWHRIEDKKPRKIYILMGQLLFFSESISITRSIMYICQPFGNWMVNGGMKVINTF